MQGASFKKHNRPDARTVIDAEFLNIEYQTGFVPIVSAHELSPPYGLFLKYDTSIIA